MKRMYRVLIGLIVTNFAAVAAEACPGSLRSFGKSIDGKASCILEDTIVGNLTLSSGFSYVLLGKVNVGSEVQKKLQDGTYVLEKPIQPATLIIQPGVKIYGLNPAADKTGFWQGETLSDGVTPVNRDMKTFLTITRDSRIEVRGRANAPVLMTSGQGAHLSSSTIAKQPGDWGGLVINGAAKSNKCVDYSNCTLPGEANTGFYGGSDDEHSSGSIEYLQVEYGGDQIDDKKQLNGITFNGVGLGTVIENVAVLYNRDDCIEFFGGAVIAKNIFCYKGLDDGIDTTDGARVFLQNGIVVAAESVDSGANDRHGVEADSSKNPEAHGRLASHPVLVNFTFVGGMNTQGLMLRRNTNFTLVNSVITGLDQWCLNIDTAGSLLRIDNNVFEGCASGDPVAGFSDNEFGMNKGQLSLNGWRPGPTSILFKGALEMEVFSEDELLDELFWDSYEPHEYVGAMGSEDWTSWINI